MSRSVFKWQDVGPIMISCATAGPIDDAEWRAFAKDLSTKNLRGYLSSVVGSVEVSSVQRKLVVDMLKEKNIPTVVITDAALVRGFITAANWFGAPVKGFSWSEVDKAIASFGQSKSLEERVREALKSLRVSCVAAAGRNV